MIDRFCTLNIYRWWDLKMAEIGTQFALEQIRLDWFINDLLLGYALGANNFKISSVYNIKDWFLLIW